MCDARVLLLAACLCGRAAACVRSVTTASGTKAPYFICSGDLIFADDFSRLDLSTWQHEITLAGGGNWEFQMYVNNRSNSFAKDGNLHIRPTLTADQYGEAYLFGGTIDLNGGALADQCTNPTFFGCRRTGTGTHILNPVTSARIRTVDSFRFRYGYMEVRAKLPAGDWLWPGIWMLPRYDTYGRWPSSGEISLVESRGNLNLTENGTNIGAEQVAPSLHFGPYYALDAFKRFTFPHNSRAGQGYDKDFHYYQLVWTPDYIQLAIDGEEVAVVTPDAGGFWDLGGFDKDAPNTDNPWKFATKMAPFDQEYYIIMNLAVGGTNAYFSDDAENSSGKKPWNNKSPKALTDFWEGRETWLPTWNLDVNRGENASLQVDYIRVWAL